LPEDNIKTGIVGTGSRRKTIVPLRSIKEQYRRIVEDQTELICRSLPDYSITFVNDACCRYFGKERKDLIGRIFLSFIPREDHEKIRTYFASINKENPVRKVEHRFVTSTGQVRWMHWIDRAIFDKKGNIVEFQSVGRDITDRKRAEEELRKERDFVKNLVETAQAIVLVLDIQGRIVSLNPYMEEVSGYRLAEVQGRDWFDTFMPERERRHIRELFAKAIGGVCTRGNINAIVTKGGQERQIEWYDNTLKDGVGRIVGLLAVGQDITERKRAEEAVRREKELAQKYLDVAAVMFIVLDSRGNITLVNRKGTEILEFDQNEIIGKNWFENFIPPDQKERLRNIFDQLMSGEIEDLEYVESSVLTKNGRERIIAWHNALLKDENGRIIGTLSSGNDITDRREAEKRLLDYQSQLKTLTAELLLAEEHERRRLAIGIHDQIGQGLVLAKLSLQSLMASLPGRNISTHLDKVYAAIDKVIQDAHSLTFELSNPVLHELGFTAAVEQWLDEQLGNKYGIKCTFNADKVHSKLDNKAGIVLFQAVRELLVNVIRHSGADTVEVCIHEVGGKIKIIIKDNGIGFNPSGPGLLSSKNKTGGFGLFGVRERLEYLKGHLNISPAQGKGTIVTLTVPLKQ